MNNGKNPGSKLYQVIIIRCISAINFFTYLVISHRQLSRRNTKEISHTLRS